MSALVEAFIGGLDEELARRRLELSNLHGLAHLVPEPRRSALARACQVMAYSHWEGFSKYALREYVNYIVRLNIPVGSLRDGLQILAMSKLVRLAAEPSRDLHASLNLWNCFEKRQHITFAVVSDELFRFGNLNSKTFRHAIQGVALEYLSAYELRGPFIDEVLCGRRHRIAHGSREPIEPAQIDDVVHGVLDLCGLLNDQVQEAALYEAYRRW